MQRSDNINSHCETITRRETAEILGISTASVQNWIKHGYLQAAGRNTFSRDQVLEVKKRLAEGSLDRLNSRANKGQSGRTFLPDELLADKNLAGRLFRLIDFIIKINSSPSAVLFVTALNLLKKKDLIPACISLRQIQAGDLDIPGRKHLSAELQSWYQADGRTGISTGTWLLLDYDLPGHRDLLGILYQSLLTEGEKAACGSYYTPPRLLRAMAAGHDCRQNLFLDPCCGTGQFLLAFADQVTDPGCLYGLDIDPLAARIARLNLHLRFPGLDFKPKVSCCDALLDKPDLPLFDIIATNPPWGCHFTGGQRSKLEDIFPPNFSGESFAYFLKQGIDWLKPGGRLIYLLPEAVLNVKTHADIREYILTHTHIAEIRHLENVFTNVFSPVIMLELRKGKKGKSTLIKKRHCSFTVNSRRFESNPEKIFNIQMNREDEKIINRIYAKKHITLKDNAEWALGIVTGDNRKYVQPQKMDRDWEAVYRGRDIKPFVFGVPGSYLRFDPHRFQQVASEKIYRAEEKLVYRFISSRLIFAYDTCKRLTLNSANILIPRLPGYPLKLVLALFNSSLYQFIFQKNFASIKVLRSHLEQLPLPLMDRQTTVQVICHTDNILQGKNDFQVLDNIIFDFFRITECDYIYKAIN